MGFRGYGLEGELQERRKSREDGIFIFFKKKKKGSKFAE